MSGLRTALTSCINGYAKKKNLLKGDNLSGDDVREGLAAIVSVKHPDPSFSSQTKDKLVSSEVTGIVQTVVYEKLNEMKIEWKQKSFTDMKNVERTAFVATQILDMDSEYGLSSEIIIGSIIPSEALNVSNEGEGMKYCATRKVFDDQVHTDNKYCKKLTDAMIWIEEYE